MEFYRVLSEYYDRLFPVSPIQMDFIAKNAAGKNRVLDLGAGTGRHALELAAAGHEVVATDSDANMTAMMGKKSSGLGKVCILKMGMEQMADLRNARHYEWLEQRVLFHGTLSVLDGDRSQTYQS